MSNTNSNHQKPLDSEQLGAFNTMNTTDGRHFIWRQLQKCGVFETMFEIDPYQNAFNSGQREAGLSLHRMVREVSPANYLKMLTENIENG